MNIFISLVTYQGWVWVYQPMDKFFNQVNTKPNEIYIVRTKEERDTLKGLGYMYGKNIKVAYCGDLENHPTNDTKTGTIFIKLKLTS